MSVEGGITELHEPGLVARPLVEQTTRALGATAEMQLERPPQPDAAISLIMNKTPSYIPGWRRRATRLLIGRLPLRGVQDPDWHIKSRCADEDPELFYPEQGRHEAAADAIRICDECLVQGDCLVHALITNEEFGVSGGLTERERRTLRKELLEAGMIKERTA